MISFTLQPALFLRYKVVKNQKYTERSQTDIKLLTVKSALYMMNIYTPRSKFQSFWNTSGTKLFKNLEMHWMTQE